MATQQATTRTKPTVFRLNAEGRFLLENSARLMGEEMTGLIERLIRDHADTLTIAGKPLLSYWDECEGMAFCKLCDARAFTLGALEQQWRRFILAHRRFFYRRNSKGDWTPDRHAIEVLWPKIEELAEHWEKHRTKDFWQIGERMQGMLKAARLAVPEWGPKAELADDEHT